MSVKRCHHCGTIMPRTFKVCPYCRKRQCFPRAIFLAVVIVALAISGYLMDRGDPVTEGQEESAPAGKEAGGEALSDTSSPERAEKGALLPESRLKSERARGQSASKKPALNPVVTENLQQKNAGPLAREPKASREAKRRQGPADPEERQQSPQSIESPRDMRLPSVSEGGGTVAGAAANSPAQEVEAPVTTDDVMGVPEKSPEVTWPPDAEASGGEAARLTDEAHGGD